LLAIGFVILMLALRDEEVHDVSGGQNHIGVSGGKKSVPDVTSIKTPLDQFDLAPPEVGSPTRPRSWILLTRTMQQSVKPDLWLYRSDGKIRLRVTRTSDVFETQPRFSPDGRRIVFVRSSTPTEMTSIWICRVDGSGQQRLVQAEVDGQRLMSPCWASDNEICFTWLRQTADEQRGEFWRMRLDHEKPLFVFDFEKALGFFGGIVADMSFDDRQLLVVGKSSLEPASTDFYLTDLQGKLLHTLWKDSGELHHDAGAIRSEGGRQIVWRHDLRQPSRSGASQYAIAYASQNDTGKWTVEIVPYADASVMPLGWSPDGRDLLCVRIPLGSPSRANAVFFLTDTSFRNARDMFDLPDWYMPRDKNMGLVADWKTLPNDVRLPLPEQPRTRMPNSPDRLPPLQ